MTLKPESTTRTRTRTRTRTTCHRHRTQPSAGICAACLRERLSVFDASDDSTHRINSAVGGDPTTSDLQRCRSVSGFTLDPSSSSAAEPRRRSCDVGDRSSLSLLFDINDRRLGPGSDSNVESNNIVLSRLARIEIGEEIRVPIDNDNDVELEGEVKPMKELIDLEIRSKNQRPKDLKNFWEAASVFSKKLRKWRQKQSKKIENGDKKRIDLLGKQKWRNFRENQSDVGRRSCDTEPRFSVDANRLSLDINPHCVIDEPRASWDGCLGARNVPMIAPRLSLGDSISNSNGLSIDGQMHSIMEDESSSGGSGSGQCNSDSSYSQRESSFDRSSSVRSFDRKGLGSECDESKSASLKLVITERELKDWHLKSVKSVKDHCLIKSVSFAKEASVVEAGKPSNALKKSSTTWRKMCKVFGFKQKLGDGSVLDDSEKPKNEISKDDKELGSLKLTRSSSVVRARNSTDKIEVIPGRKSISEGIGFGGSGNFLPERSKNSKCNSTNLDNGVLPFYLMPLRSSRSRNSRSMLLNSDCISERVLN